MAQPFHTGATGAKSSRVPATTSRAARLIPGGVTREDPEPGLLGGVQIRLRSPPPFG